MGDEEDDSEAVVLTELLTAVMSGNTKSLATLVDRFQLFQQFNSLDLVLLYVFLFDYQPI